MSIYVFNRSSVVSHDDVKIMVEACNLLLPTFFKVWDRISMHLIFVGDGVTGPKTIPAGSWSFEVIDTDASVSDALAYHTEANDQVIGFVLAKTILDNGGVKLYKDGKTPTVASALFHEVTEALMDPTVNGWWQANDGTLYAAEVCDPVQSNLVEVEVGTVKVGLSDFIYPAWHDTEAPKTVQFNYTHSLHAPFVLSPGGYAVVCQGGQTNQIYGDELPQWVRDMKQKSFRNIRRDSCVASKPKSSV